MKKYTMILFLALVLFSCEDKQEPKATETNDDRIGLIDTALVNKTINILIGKFGDKHKFRIERGVEQAAQFWKGSDGEYNDFQKFCEQNFVSDQGKLDELFESFQRNHEIISGNFNRMMLELQEPVQLDRGPISNIDYIYSAFNPASNLKEDLFKNKAAFITLLNFPNYNLKEKNTLSNQWDNKKWAYARMGDLYTSRVPAEVLQKFSQVNSEASAYIDSYNIFMGKLIDERGETSFPKDMKLITHWNLRDELKSQYSEKNGLEKQKMIYFVMKHIINQTIPNDVINNDEYYWNPVENELFDKNKNGVNNAENEKNERYQQLLNNFNALKMIDEYSPVFPTYIQRKFNEDMELTFDNVENIFVELLTSDARFAAAELIVDDLKRPLQPFDIWYNGFKPRGKYTEDELDKITRSRFKTSKDFKSELPLILAKFGFNDEDVQRISEKVIVEPSRGAGHASGAEMREDVSRLRTRIGSDGMDYKGYNIAVHEFGHNVEQTISLHDVPNYMMNGVPNNAFTEAAAFVFQSRDLEFLGLQNDDEMQKHMYALDNFWSTYEIMGVALVDMYVWKWMYDNPDANAEMLKAQVINIAKDVWNKYYSDVFGVRDSEILAVYSHMVAYPLYLSAYPLGHLIEFQMEQYFEEKNKAKEFKRIMQLGKMTPKAWMETAFGTKLSPEPLINATNKAIEIIKTKKEK